MCYTNEEEVYMMDLERFTTAHQRYFKQALKEVKSGNKKTHWMWFIFPQIIGLGKSYTAIY